MVLGKQVLQQYPAGEEILNSSRGIHDSGTHRYVMLSGRTGEALDAIAAESGKRPQCLKAALPENVLNLLADL